MSIADMQSCLARVYVDDAFRKLFFLAVDEALLGYRLTEDERRAVTQLNRRMVEFFAASLKKKRRTRLQRAYPMLFALNEAEIDRYCDRYYQLYTLHRTHTGHQDVLDFGVFMEDSLGGDESFPTYAPDVAKFERLYYAAAFAHIRSSSDRLGIDAVSNGVNLDVRPSLEEGVWVVSASYDLEAVREALERGEDPDDPPRLAGDFAFVFQPPADSPAPRTLRLNSAAKAVLLLCDGRRSVSTIVSELEDSFGTDGLQEGVLETIRRLVDRQVLRVSNRG
jgi:hypothetical protein